jgi:hypothetical protein
MCFDFLYKFVWNISLSKKNSAWQIGLYVKYRLFLSDFSKTKYTYIKKTQMSNFMKIRPVGAELFHLDRRTNGRTDRQSDEANSHFSQFCERALNAITTREGNAPNLYSL